MAGTYSGEILEGPAVVGEFPFEVADAPERDGVVGLPIARKIPAEVLGVDDPSNLKLITRDPDGKIIPSKLVIIDGEISLEFTPHKPGLYLGQIFSDSLLIAEIPIEISAPDVIPHLSEKPAVGKPTQGSVPLQDLGITEDPEKLTFVLLDPTGEEIPAKLHFVDNDVKLEFTPHMPGVYKGEFWNGDELIAEFPIKVPGPEDLVPGKPASAGISMDELGADDPSQVSLRVLDPDGKEIPSQLIFKDGEALLEFTPTRGGIHVAQISVDGKIAAEIPIAIDEADVPGSAPKPMRAAFPLSALGVDDFNTVSLVLTDPTGKEIPCEVSLEDGNVTITFIPTVNGTYKGKISVNGNPVAEIPIEVNRPDLRNVTPEEMAASATPVAPTEGRTAGKPVSTGIPMEALGTDDPSQVSLIVKHPNGHSIPSSLLFRDGEAFLEFTPDQGGLYKAEFYVGGVKVAEIPIHIEDPRPVKPMAAAFPLSALGVDDFGRLSFVLKDPSHREIPSKFGYVDPNVTIEFTPTYRGTYIGEISLDGAKMAEIPIEVTRPELPEPKPEEMVKVEEKPKPMAAAFPLSALGDPDPATVGLVLKDPTGKEIPFDMVIKDGNVCLEFTPTFNGTYIGEISINGKKIAEIPIEVNRPNLQSPSPEDMAAAATTGATPSTGGSTKPMQAAFPLSALGIDDPQRLSVVLLDPTKKEIPVKIIFQDGNAILEFVPTFSGTYIGQIFIDGNKVAEIPIEVNRPELPVPSPEQMISEPKKETPGKPMLAAFPLSALGVEDTSLLEIKLRDPTKTEIPVKVGFQDGNVTLEFTPTFNGTYIGEIYVSGKKVAEIPIDVNRPELKTPTPEEMRKEGASLVGTGKQQSAGIPQEALGGVDPSVVTVKLADPTGKQIPCQLLIKDGETLLDFTAQISGTHMASLYANDLLLCKFPIEVTLPRFQAPKIRVAANADLVLIPIDLPPDVDWRLVIVRITTITLIFIRTVVLIYHEGVKVELVPPSELGDYYLHLEIDGVPLPGSPVLFEVYLTPAVTPIGTEQSVQVGQPACIPFQAENISARKLSVKITAPDGKDISCTLTVLADDRCDLEFTPVEEGTHEATFSADGSPVSIVPLEIGISRTETTTKTTTTTTTITTITEQVPVPVNPETEVSGVPSGLEVKALGDKCIELLNGLSAFRPTATLPLVEFRSKFFAAVEAILEVTEKTEWVVVLKKPDAELFPLFSLVIQRHMTVLLLLIENLCLIQSESIRTQLINLLQQNLPKILPVYIQVVTNVMLVSSGREAVAANFDRIVAAMKQVWTNALQTFKTYKGGSPPDALTGIDTGADTNTVLNGLISFLNSEKATLASNEILCQGFSIPNNFSEAVALWPQVFRTLVTELKAVEVNVGELIFQSARAVLFYRRMVLEPHGHSVKDWNKAAALLNTFSQQLVNLLAAKLTDQDIMPKLTEVVGTVKEIQAALV